jgi:hypothetical protein
MYRYIVAEKSTPNYRFIWLHDDISNEDISNENLSNEDISKIDISNEDISNVLIYRKKIHRKRRYIEIAGNSARSNSGPIFWSRLFYFRPIFGVKIGVASWVRRGRRPRPAAGRPNPIWQPQF